MAKRRIPSYSQYGPNDEIVQDTLPQFGNDGDGADAEGSDDSDTAPVGGLDGLSALLGGGFKAPPATYGMGANRNDALASGIARHYGVDPSASQADLEALDSYIRDADVNDRLAATMPIARMQSETQAAQEAARAKNALDVENLKGTYGLRDQALKNQGALAAKSASAPTPPDDDLLNFLAAQSGRDASTLTKIPMNMRSAVLGRMAYSGTDINQMSNQTRQMSETANDLLPMIDDIVSQAQQLHQKGQFDLISSPLRQFFVKHGAGTVLGYGNDAAENMGRFQTALGLLQSGVARAHAGARGAGNTEMANRFEQLMNAQGDLPTFLGQLQGVKDLLSRYAAHTAPTGQAAPASDPYADPNYQPR